MLILSRRITIVIGIYICRQLVLALGQVGEGLAQRALSCSCGAHVRRGQGAGILCIASPCRPRARVDPVIQIIRYARDALCSDVDSFA